MRISILKVKVRRFIARYLSLLVRLVFYIIFKTYNFKKKPPIIILTPGKVGSSSVYYTLKNNMKDNHVFHIHQLSDLGINNSINTHLNSDRKSLPLHLIISNLLNKKLKDYNGEVSFVTLIREPTSRAISDIFQNIDLYAREFENSNLKINELKLLDKVSQNITESLKYMDNWINLELKTNLDINVYDEVFSTNIGFKIFNNNNRIKLLLIRMEDLNSSFENATIKYFNKTKGIKLEDYNIGEEKYYSGQYKSLKSKIKFGNAIIDKILSSKYVIHFYGDYTNKITNKYGN
jgi:hypothetical protein